VFREGEAVSLEVAIKTLEAVGADKVITFDLHSIKIPEFFKIPVTHLSALPLFAEKIRETIGAEVAHENFLVRDAKKGLPSNRFKNPASSHNENFVGSPRFDNSTLVSPDMGGIRRIKILSEMLNSMPYVTIEKNRDLKSGKIKVSEIHGRVGKVAFVIDDMISTGNTIAAAAKLLRKKGAGRIFVFATHPVFSGNAAKTLQESSVEKVFVTDTIMVPKEKLFPKLEVLSVAEMIVNAIKIRNPKR
jgi:ribose-phosphate pyrophosphokinase